jgi:hypothetical protein
MENQLQKYGIGNSVSKNHTLHRVIKLMAKPVKLITVLFLIISLSFSSCQKSTKAGTGEQINGVKKLRLAVNSIPLFNVACTSSSSNKIEVYDQTTDWDATGPVWSWMPTTAEGYSSTEVGYWVNGSSSTGNTGDPFEVKLRNNSTWSGTSQVIATVGGRLATVFAYPGKQKLWSHDMGTAVWPHPAEIIPNGNVATASSTGNVINLFNTTFGATNSASATLSQAHGVLWDPVNYVLWAIGETTLTAYTTGSKTSPTLTEVTSRRTTLPEAYGHDIAAYFGDNNKLWVATTGGVYVYDKTLKTFTPSAGSSFKTHIKGVGNQPASALDYVQIVTTKEIAGCSYNTWCTDTVKFYNASTGTRDYERHRTGAAFYKVRIFSPNYQDAPAAPLADGNYVITNRLSNKAIAVKSASTDDDAGIIQYGYSAAAPNNDQWTLAIQPDGYYRIINLNSGKDLVIKSAGREKSDLAIQHTYSTAAPYNDEWSIVPVGGGYFKIVSRNSDLVLNVDDASLVDGANIIQYTFTDVPQSEWLFSVL